MIASALTVALLLSLLGFSSWDKKQRLDGAQKELTAARLAAAAGEAELSQLKDKVAQSQTRIEQLENDRDTALQAQLMRRRLDGGDGLIGQAAEDHTLRVVTAFSATSASSAFNAMPRGARR